MAGKTGTTNDYKDSWFIYDGRVVTAWLGTDDNKATWLRQFGRLTNGVTLYQQVKPEPLSLVPVEGLTFQSYQKQGTRIADNCQQAIVYLLYLNRLLKI